MATAGTPTPAQTREGASEPEHLAARRTPIWQKYGVPALVVLIAVAVVVTVTWNWNSGRVDGLNRPPTMLTFAGT